MMSDIKKYYSHAINLLNFILMARANSKRLFNKFKLEFFFTVKCFNKRIQ